MLFPRVSLQPLSDESDFFFHAGYFFFFLLPLNLTVLPLEKSSCFSFKYLYSC